MTYETKADDAVVASLEIGMEDSARAGGNAQAIDAAQLAELKDEVQSLGQAIGEMRVKAARPLLSATSSAGMATTGEAKAFVERYLRKGIEGAAEVKAFALSPAVDGGYAIPTEIDARIDATLKSVSPIRAVANVVKVGSANYRKLVASGGFASGWVSDSALRPETDTPDFNEIAPAMGELYANPAASQSMLDDAAFDVEAWLGEEIGREFGVAEGVAFVSGTGVNQPKGFLTYATAATADSARAFGTLQHVATGVSGAFAATAPEDALIDLVHALRPVYRQGAVFVMNSKTLARVRKMKDADGTFLWRPGLEAGQPATLLGYPVIEAEAMPDIAASSLSIAFGNFASGYVIAERAETRILRDPYSRKPFVHFYATKRVGGAVSNSEAIKLLKFAVS
jgi:HK97 family phage major capsid protein